jgi:hypothetical protein
VHLLFDLARGLLLTLVTAKFTYTQSGVSIPQISVYHITQAVPAVLERVRMMASRNDVQDIMGLPKNGTPHLPAPKKAKAVAHIPRLSKSTDVTLLSLIAY